MIGWAKLAKGRHTLTFVCRGKNSASTAYNLGIDTFILPNVAPQPATDQTGDRA